MNAIETLRANVGKLPERDRGFAQSLLDQAGGRGLSPKQFAWVDRLVARATTAPTMIGNIAGIVDFMQGAVDRGLKRPKIRLRTEGGIDMVLGIAGSSSRQPGTVLVLGRGTYGERPFYGRVCLDGSFMPGRDATAENTPDITSMLQAMAVDPKGTARAYGDRIKLCCFCGIALSDPHSEVAGYGPICAKRWGLPWGTRP